MRGSNLPRYMLEITALVLMVTFFAKVIPVAESRSLDPVDNVSERHAELLVLRVNPGADSAAISLTAAATRFALTKDGQTWRSLVSAARKGRGTNEIITSRIRSVIRNDSLLEAEKMLLVTKIVTGQKPVALMPGSSGHQLSPILPADLSPIEIRREDGMVTFDYFALLIIGRNAMASPYREYYNAVGPILNDYVSSGGAVLILPQDGNAWANQWLPGRIAASNQTLPDSAKVEIKSPDHPILSGAGGLATPASGRRPTSEYAAYPLAGVGEEWRTIVAADIDGAERPLIAELPYDRGRFIICQLPVDSDGQTNLQGSRLLDNIVEYLLSESSSLVEIVD